jgi:PIN domain nuclease of toxin-antitoxin system
VLLTTSALLWVAQGEGAVSAAALQCIDAAPVGSVLTISGFVMGSKVQQGKVHLPVSPANWFAAILAHPTREGLTLNLGICLRSTALPASHATWVTA